MNATQLRFTVRGETLREISEHASVVIKDFGLAPPAPVNMSVDVQREETHFSQGSGDVTTLAYGFVADVTVRFQL